MVTRPLFSSLPKAICKACLSSRVVPFGIPRFRSLTLLRVCCSNSSRMRCGTHSHFLKAKLQFQARRLRQWRGKEYPVVGVKSQNSRKCGESVKKNRVPLPHEALFATLDTSFRTSTYSTYASFEPRRNPPIIMMKIVSASHSAACFHIAKFHHLASVITRCSNSRLDRRIK